MRRRSSLVIFLIAAAAAMLLAVWQLPALLKAVPSRYVARLPEPIQTIGARYQGELLPTASIDRDLGERLLTELQTPAATSRQVPASPTPPPTSVQIQEPNVTAPISTRTPSVLPSPSPTTTMQATPTPSLPPSATLSGVEHRIQTWNNCGPATLSMALSYFDLYHPQTQIADAIKPDPEDRNVTPEEMVTYVGSETELQAISRVNGRLQMIRQFLSEGIPVIVEYGLQPENEYRWLDWLGHYLLVTAYDDEQESMWVFDSWPRTGEIPDENFVFEPIEISYEELDRNWRAFNRAYIAIYEPEKADVVAAIVGDDVDDDTMWQNALGSVQDELQAEPENAFLWFNLGTVFNASGDYERAAAAFDQARAIGLPWRMLWYQFGPYEAYYQMGRFDEVILLADITLKDRPYFEEAYFYKALAQLELGQVDEARGNLQKAIEFNPNFTRAKTSLEALDRASS